MKSILMPRSSRCVLAVAFTLSAFVPALCAAQSSMAGMNMDKPADATPNSTIYVNPRSGSDDPRVGLKGGLYDAGTAISGLELV